MELRKTNTNNIAVYGLYKREYAALKEYKETL